MPGFAPVSEWAYAFIAARRAAFYRISLFLWGRNYEPPRYELVSFLFLRLLGLVYLTAFVSFAVAYEATGVTLDQARTAATLTLLIVGLWVLNLLARPITPACSTPSPAWSTWAYARW